MTPFQSIRQAVSARLQEWGWNWEHADWSNWRTYSPAAGSAIAHVALIGAAIGITAAFSERAPDPAPHVLEIALVEDTPPPPPPEITRTPPPTPPVAEREPDSAPILPSRKKTETESAPRPESSATSANEGVYIPPSPLAPGVAGLASLMDDPCKTKTGLKVENCGAKPFANLAEAKAYEQMTKAEKEQFFAEYTPDCPYRVGCDTGPWRGAGGTRSVFRPNGGPMMSGAGGLGGIHDLVGRLGFNPEHTDPGFGD
ncbi:MAG TPA: hypothetical protein VGO52_02380 [Hyphomonadaceae bacterium]|nr:hypothetical protein [Hyphomonadaceae bacterium]